MKMIGMTVKFSYDENYVFSGKIARATSTGMLVKLDKRHHKEFRAHDGAVSWEESRDIDKTTYTQKYTHILFSHVIDILERGEELGEKLTIV